MQTFFDNMDATSLLRNTDDNMVLKELGSIFRPLSEISEDYPEQVLTYLLTGNNPHILTDLQSRTDDKAGSLLGFPGTVSYHWGTYDPSKKQQRLVTQSKNARHRLYKRIFTALHAEQIVRYSKLLVAATRLDNYTVLSPLSPEWLSYFLVDGLCSSQDDYQPNLKKRQNWQYAHLLELLAAEEVDNPYEVLINLIFDRKGMDDYYTDKLSLFYKLPDTLDILTQQHALVESIIPKLSAKGQKQFIDEFAKKQPAYIKKCPKLVATLSASSSKTVKELAMAKINAFEPEVIKPHLQQIITTGNAKQRREVADILARMGADSREVLQTALENEKQKSVIQAITAAISRLDSLEQASEVEFVVPEFEPIVSQDIPDSFTEVIVSNYQELLEKKRIAAEKEVEQNKSADYQYRWAQRTYQEWKKIKIEATSKKLISALNGHEKLYIFNNNNYTEILIYKKQLQNLPEFGLHQACRIMSAGNGHFWWWRLFELVSPDMLHNIGLHHLVQVLEDCDLKNAKRAIAEEYLQDKYQNDLPRSMSRPEQILPFFMENLDFLAEALGLLPNKSENRWYCFLPQNAIKILQKFPHIPRQYIPKLLELALGENKRLRHDAQELLSDLPNIHERAIEALSNGKQAIRVTAVEWLARLHKRIQTDQPADQKGDQQTNQKSDQKSDKKGKSKSKQNNPSDDIIKALYALLKKEKKEVVIASILTSLEGMGEDISKYLSPTALLKDAEKGLKGKILKSFQWFDLTSLPKLKWQNGKNVNPKVIQWWVVLAEKLKDPTPNGLLQRYMGLLDTKSQQTLSLFVLQTFIHEDTRNPTLDEAMAIANKEAPGRLQRYQDWYKRWGKNDPDGWYAKYANMTLEQVVEEIKNEHLSIYLGSAIKSKGMLALAYLTHGSTAVKLIQSFMKQHYRRNAQIIALLTAFSVSDDPLIIQLLLGLSRRYRTQSVQDLAKKLVGTIAERNHWTADELADRTIPSAGLDDNGIMTLDYGSRTLTAHVNDKDKFVLQNEDGKTIKSLPAPRQSDGDNEKALIKEAKALFSTSKKELKQVLELQTARLYEAMCSQRVWSSSDWQEYLFAHPIMKRLVTRLVWLEMDGNQADANIISSFRPSDDGCLLDVDDEEVTLGQQSFVKLAHGMLLPAEECESWQEHLTDYEIKPLFGGSGKLSSSKGMVGTQTQFDNACPEFKKAAEQIDEFKGYVTDTFTLRGVLTKLGYQRASIEDGGSFDRYYKNYDSLGMSAVIVFSGSYVPEENIPAVVYELCFEEKQSYSWNTDYIALEEVSPILLAESYAEYKTLADATGGFDKDWESKTPW